jgi:hypothetical protein
MTHPDRPDPAPAVEYHWIITLNGHVGPDQDQVTVGGNGTEEIQPGSITRQEICDTLTERIKNEFLKRTGMLLENPNVLFFAVEPNQL